MAQKAPRVVMPKQTEKDFQAAVLEYAEIRKWHWFHDQATNAPRVCWNCRAPARGPRNTAGWPDLFLVRRPQLIVAELKKQDGVVSSDQQAWIDELRACGQTVYVWRPSDWDEILRVLA